MSQRPPIIDLTANAQFREAIAVHEAVHGDPETVWEEFLYRHPVWSAPGAHRAILDDDRIVALTTLAMWRHRIGGSVLTAGEIGLVGTLPDHRKHGHSRALMESWIATMREQDVPLAFLIGIPGFYEQWDFHYAAPDQVNHFLAIRHDALARCAEAGTARDASPDDAPAIAALIARETIDTPCSPVIDEALVRYFIDRAEAHGVAWRVIASGGEITGVVRMKRWGEGIGPQAQGAVTLVAAHESARPAIAAELLDHLNAGNQAELPLAVAPHGPFARWLHLRGAMRKCDRSTFPGGYAAMYRVNDLMTVLKALRQMWDQGDIVQRFDGVSITLRTGRDPGQIATIAVLNDGIDIDPGDDGVDIGAPPAVTVPWITGWRSASDWLDGTPFPPLPGPAFNSGRPDALPDGIRGLLRALFPARHPYIGDTIQGA